MARPALLGIGHMIAEGRDTPDNRQGPPAGGAEQHAGHVAAKDRPRLQVADTRLLVGSPKAASGIGREAAGGLLPLRLYLVNS